MADRMYPGALHANRDNSSNAAQTLPHATEPAATTAAPNDTSRDEQIARELQMQLDTAAMPVIAQPMYQVPYSCGACGTTHAVRNVSHGAEFTCTMCGAANRIVLQQHRQPVVVVGGSGYYPVPIPILCTIL